MQIVVREGALCVVRALWCFICDVKESCKPCHLCHHSLRALSLFDLSLSPSPLPLQALQAHSSKPEVIFETDGRHSNTYRYEPPMGARKYAEPIDEVLDLGVDTIS